ncbi:DHH family phosphoesterase [Methanogenium organophilum]|uniref:OB-fold nucleic acid binding domain-containing protein n=1 Tax=Methanogenium organophilum TaxID=2199 RepID=A0A9X9S4V8_METOG|nr:OB-fold nucleic acid binding domain-containing protein [Methanogenium organophilum]WAI01513.1 OB-fold nucleic acid binding domain-containing protein [Methanogenium organophilum]
MNNGEMTVYRLSPACDVGDVEEGKVYVVRVQGFADFGTFVYLNDRIKGLIHKSNVKTHHQEGETLFVRVRQVRKNGNIDLEEIVPTRYNTETVAKKLSTLRLADLPDKVGRHATIEAEVAQIKQTSGPTIFTIVDETGAEDAAAFIEAGVRAYPEVELGDMVSVSGEVMLRNNRLQIEVSNMRVLSGEERENVDKRIAEALELRAEPEDLPFMIESDVLNRLKPEMQKVAKIIRKAIFTAQPIVLRHHADADGISAAVAVERAVTHLIRENGGDLDTESHMFKRAPSKAPFYEIEDVTRDLDFALKDFVRFGQKLPLIVMMDNGSTEEDEPSYRMAKIYDIPIVVVDHHHPDESTDAYLDAHVNPYHVGGDFGVTAGMLGAELARMIFPGVEDEIRYFPAVAAVGDRSEAPERQQYLDLVSDEWSEDHCKDIALALDYEQFWLRFNDGREIVKDILGVNGDRDRHERLVTLLVREANLAIEEQLSASMPHVVEQELGNTAKLFMLDVEIYAHRFTFPPPGKTSGEVHDILCRRNEGAPVVTLGIGPDFVVIRSRGVLMNIPKMVRELREEVIGGGVNGGGHLVVGSIKFVEGMRETVIESLIAKIEEFPVE